MVSRYKAGFRHWELWVNLRKLAVVVAQVIVAVLFSPVSALCFVLLVQVVAFILQRRLRRKFVSSETRGCCGSSVYRS